MTTGNKDEILFETVVAGGWSYSLVVKRGTSLRLTDLDGGGNVSVLMYNNANYSERYNMGDTLKIQHISYLCKDRCIYSDMGRILMSIVEDSFGSHDVICGVSDASSIANRFGSKPYHKFHNDYFRNGYDSLLTELAKYGMTRRDFTNVINFFSRIDVSGDGALSFAENMGAAGDQVTLRAEMDVLVVLDTNMHPLNPSIEYQPKDIGLCLLRSEQAAENDGCRNFCPENLRGFINTKNYFLSESQ